MTEADLALTVAVGALVVSGLVYFADRGRGRSIEQRATDREGLRARDGKIDEIVSRYHDLVRETRASPCLMTVRDAGIAELREDAAIREALTRIARAGRDPIAQHREALKGVDLVKYFDFSLKHNVSADSPSPILEALRSTGTNP